MKIAILGTRGIPNNYGGPETNAEMMAPIFLRFGHEVTVYSPDEHPYAHGEWNGIRLKRVFNHESRLGIWGTLIYDYLCLRDACRADFDIILELGYVPCALFIPFRRKERARLVTNMDGLEWKRSKWNFILQRFAEFTEYLGARFSDALIADNEAIKAYLHDKYGKHSYFIPYGAQPVSQPSGNAHLKRLGLTRSSYYMLIARMEPENNVEMILDGYVASGDDRPFVVVGKTITGYAGRLLEKYANNPRIRFVGGIYDYDELSSLRWDSTLYFHGHSVGGTNPSLVEAMASRALIVAHENPFNRAVLESNALYFSSAYEVSDIIRSDHSGVRKRFLEANLAKVDSVYNWEKVAKEHLRVFDRVLAGG